MAGKLLDEPLMSLRKPHPRHAQKGFTLIELMVTVAIVAILASVAVFAYIKHIRAGRIVQGKAFLGIIQARQESYFQQFGYYCDASASGMHPLLIAGSEPVNKEWNPSTSTAWLDLQARPESGYTYFQWDVRASSLANKHALFGLAATLGIPAQPTTGTPHPWWYATGEADFDGLGSPYTELRTSSVRSEIITLNEGK